MSKVNLKVAHCCSGRFWPLLLVEAADLGKVSRSLTLMFAIIVGAAAFVGMAALQASLIATAYWSVFAFALAIVRNRLVSALAGQSFPAVSTLERIVGLTVRICAILTVIGIVSLVLFGFRLWAVAYIVVSLTFPYMYVLDSWREGRLCFNQFLSEKASRIPEYSWLKRALEIVSEKIETLGASVPASKLFLGASYSILQDMDLNDDLRNLSQWIVKPEDEPMELAQLYPPLSRLLAKAKEAEEAGFTIKKTFREHATRLPWSDFYSMLVLVAVILALLLGRQIVIP